MPRSAHFLTFKGSAHPTGQDESYDGIFLKKSEIRNLAKLVVGTPIWYEHGNKDPLRKKVGWVRRGSVDDRGRLIIHGVIDRNSFQGTYAARNIVNGKLKGLSLGLDHLQYKDDERKIMQIVSKAIEEVSVTEDPDLPDTEIISVKPDSELWNLTRKRVEQGLAKHKTKTQILKNRTELERIRKERDDRAKAMSDSAQSSSAAANTAQGTPNDEMQALKMKLEAQQKRMAELEAEKAAQERELAEARAAGAADALPDDLQRKIIAKHEARMQQKRAEMAEEEASIIDRVTADIIASGEKPNPELIEMIKMGKDRPEAYAPLYKYVKSQAGAASAKRASEMEAKYQEQQKELEQLRERLGQSDAITAQQQAQFKAQQEAAARKAQYGNMVEGQPPRKRAREDEYSDTAASTTMPTHTASAASADIVFGGAAPVGVSYYAPPMQPAEVMQHDNLFAMFETHKGQRQTPSDKVQLLSSEGVRPSFRADRRATAALFDMRDSYA